MKKTIPEPVQWALDSCYRDTFDHQRCNWGNGEEVNELQLGCSNQSPSGVEFIEMDWTDGQFVVMATPVKSAICSGTNRDYDVLWEVTYLTQ
jgi:hypothetical protein